eukprot:TRINITY_DN6414_c0_g1_i5.p2 TRINITY_DN6414_c0_g1~~TRINITY_DN6414_c0_g1_i5.p2  ORF type:complete len:108 (+),score=18.86 TRINITY_DN6414_c0_g1_i5:47-370(+)
MGSANATVIKTNRLLNRLHGAVEKEEEESLNEPWTRSSADKKKHGSASPEPKTRYIRQTWACHVALARSTSPMSHAWTMGVRRSCRRAQRRAKKISATRESQRVLKH